MQTASAPHVGVPAGVALARIPSQHRRWHTAIANMPLAVTVETAHGPFGLVHADVPNFDWAVATAMLEAETPDAVDTALLGVAGPKEVVRRHRSRPVEGLRTLVHGQFLVDEVEQIANRWNVDTGASLPGRDRLTLLQASASRFQSWTFDGDEAV